MLLIFTPALAGFVDRTAQAGLPQSTCSWGMAFGDYDADGDPDVYLHNHIQGLLRE